MKSTWRFVLKIVGASLALAGIICLFIGFWESLEDIRRNWAVDRTFTPAISPQEQAEKLRGWHRAVERSFAWAKE